MGSVAAASGGAPVLEVRDACKAYGGIRRWGIAQRSVRAVDGVSLDVGRAETVGLVGESGCGKSTLARLLVRLEKADAGEAMLGGVNIFTLRRAELAEYRKRIQMVFQDTHSSLNPRITVGESVIRAWRVHPGMYPPPQYRERAERLFELVGLDPARVDAYPHQLSGGQRQRVGIARALALGPDVVICDEAVSALDVSVQAQVLALLSDLQQRLGVSYLFISHDLAVVRRISSRVVVMYLGRVMETGPVGEVFERPAHPYTTALLSAAPSIDARKRDLESRTLLQGDPPNPANPPSGCRFRTRCPKAQQVCAEEAPLLRQVGEGGRLAACHFPNTN